LSFVRRATALATLLLLALTACARTTSPPVETVPNLTAADLDRAVLKQVDVGDGWTNQGFPDVTTVQIGGRIGPANADHDSAQATSAFTQKSGSGSISNSVFLITSVRVAQAIIRAHRQAATKTTWTQDRDDGTKASFKRVGTVKHLPPLGDQMFSEAMKVKITDPEGKVIGRNVNYVVYRTGALLGFTVTQDVAAARYAARQERRVSALLGS
jgi:hypothetical protein